ncbi:MAG: peptidoglycan bridge formation glycyltransferase FemA/FemB family protein [Anaerolineae bacterium]|nr:peptidoglycan bridge formation glycyltransferase FemA/FemB family protein [Anaerolineae bacterium]
MTPNLKLQSVNPTQWNDLIRPLPGAHILQTADWGAFKQRQTGWQPDHLAFYSDTNVLVGAAMLLTRRIGPFAVMYTPKGPILDYADSATATAILDQLERLARQRRAIWLKIDADVPVGIGEPNSAEAQDRKVGQKLLALLRSRGWQFSDSQVQFRNTIQIDLTQSEDQLLAQMGQGKRRKVRYGPRHGVTVRSGTIDDLPLLHKLYAETGKRDGFITRPYDYYVDEWGTLIKAGMAHPLIAEVNGQAVAHVILFHFGRVCWYFTGASVSDPELRRLMPTDLLQWEGMKWAKAQGYSIYDMYGAPSTFDPSDPMWGVYEFKRDFGGTLVRTIGAWDYAPSKLMYTLYTRLMPRVISVMRRRAASATR